MKRFALLTFLIFVLVWFYQTIQRHDQSQKVLPEMVEEMTLAKEEIRKKPKVTKPIKRQKKSHIQNRSNKKANIPQKKDFAKSKNHHYQLPSGDLVLTQVFIEPDHGWLIAHGDIIVSDGSDLDQIQSGKKTLILPKPQLWPNSTVPYSFESSLLPEQKKEIARAINYLQDATPIKFVKRIDQRDYVAFAKGTENCYSNLGRIGGKQFIKLSPGCSKNKIVHEIMHALGFFHEQNRADRDDYVEVLWENIDESNWPNFQIIEDTFFNLTEFPFDYNSLMMYSSNFFSLFPDDYSMVRDDGTPIFLPDDRLLSPNDIKRVKRYYGK